MDEHAVKRVVGKVRTEKRKREEQQIPLVAQAEKQRAKPDPRPAGPLSGNSSGSDIS
jgi:hypothetical protein